MRLLREHLIQFNRERVSLPTDQAVAVENTLDRLLRETFEIAPPNDEVICENGQVMVKETSYSPENPHTNLLVKFLLDNIGMIYSAHELRRELGVDRPPKMLFNYGRRFFEPLYGYTFVCINGTKPEAVLIGYDTSEFANWHGFRKELVRVYRERLPEDVDSDVVATFDNMLKYLFADSNNRFGGIVLRAKTFQYKENGDYQEDRLDSPVGKALTWFLGHPDELVTPTELEGLVGEPLTIKVITEALRIIDTSTFYRTAVIGDATENPAETQYGAFLVVR